MTSLPDVPLGGLYGHLILDHYRNPRNREPVPNADIEAEEFNPFCGDRIVLQLGLDSEGRVAQACSRSEGCSIIQASASMMADLAFGKSLGELEDLAELFRSMMRGERSSDGITEELGDLKALEVVRAYPVRIKCALLPWVALEEGIARFRKQSE